MAASEKSSSSSSSNVKISKIILELNNCVIDLKNDFKDSMIPINDDSTSLHKFCVKLEYLLQSDMKEKLSLLGKKKNYWDYLYKCLARGKNPHDGIIYVKRIAEIHTSEGRGRAFIRFCLMHQCLGDTIQKCLHDQKLLREWYDEKSPLLDSNQTSFLISSLYELNDCSFDLIPYGVDLDIAWPTFARKAYSSPYSWKLPSRHPSISSLGSSISLQNDSFCSVDDQAVGVDAASKSYSLFSEIEDLQGTLEKCQKENCLLKSANKEIKEQFSQAEESLRKQIESLEQEVDELHKAPPLQSNHELINRIEQSVQTEDRDFHTKREDDHNYCATNNNFLENSLQQSLKRVYDQFTSVDGISKTIELKLKQNAADNSTGDVNPFLDAIAEMKTSLNSFSSDYDKLIGNINSLTIENHQLRQTLSPLQSENEELKDKVESLHREVARYKEYKAFPQLQEQTSALKDALATAKKIIGLKDMKIEKLQNEVQKHKPPSDSVAKPVSTPVSSKAVELSEIWPPPSDPNSTSYLFYEQVNKLYMHLEKSEKEKGILINIVKLAAEIQTGFETQTAETKEQLDESEKRIRISNEKLQKMLVLIDNQEKHIDVIKKKLDSSLLENKKLTKQMAMLNELLQQIEKTETNKEMLDSKQETVAESSKCKPSVEEASADDSENRTVNNASASLGTDEPVIVAKVNRTLSKLHSLIEEKIELQQELETSKEMASSLLNKVAEQEQQLSTVTTELTQTKDLVSKLRAAFSSVQTNESILRYEVKEKRHLLNKLKAQLESSRAQWNQVRQKNSESQIEWQSLREEFAQRHKQGSEESGFSDDASKADQKNQGSFDLVESDTPQSEVFGEIIASPDEVSSPSDGFPSEDDESDPRDRRLRFLEEQCRLLCGKLLRSAKYGAALDMRLTSLHDHYGSGENEDNTPEEQESIEQELTSDTNDVESVQLSSVECSSLKACDEHESVVADSVASEAVPYIPVDISNETEDSSHQQKPTPIVLAQALPKRIEKLRKEKEELQEELQRINNCYQLSEAREVHLNAQIQLFQVEKEELLKKLHDAQEQVLENTKREEKSSNAIDVQRYDDLIKLKDTLQTKLETISKKLEEKTSYMEEMEKKLSQSEMELSTVKFQLNTEALEHQNNLKTYLEQESCTTNELQNQLNKQEMVIKNLEKQLDDVTKEYEKEQEINWKKLKELNIILTSKNNECTKLSEDLETERKINNDLQEENRNLIMSNDEKTSKLEEEISGLQSENNDLKKRIVQLLKDKDVLWKQTESLTFWRKLQTSGSMLADETSVKCNDCNTEFSLTVKKHQCRSCGDAFCSSCCDNWIMQIGSSTKKRICDKCSTEINKDGAVNAYINYSFNKESDDPVLEKRSFSSGSKSSLNNSGDSITRTSSIEDFHVVQKDDAPENKDLHEMQTEQTKEKILCSDITIYPVSPEDVLRGGNEIKLKILAGNKYGLPVHIESVHCSLHWHFQTESKDIAFYILYKESLDDANPEADVIVPFDKYDSHLNVIEGHLVPKKAGVYILVLDNSYSRFTAKTVTIGINLQQHQELQDLKEETFKL